MDIEHLTNEMQDLKTLILQRKSKELGRPALGNSLIENNLHQKALDGYIRRGDEVELRNLNLEEKGLSSAVNSDGGFLVDPATSNQIATSLGESASIRGLASVVAVEATSYDVLIDHGEFEAGWAGENQSRVETGAADFARISIPLHELSAMPKSSQRLLDDAAFDVETWLAERIADSFAQSESLAFVQGDGVDKPKGFLAHPVVSNSNWQWGKLGAVKTGVDGDFAADYPADAVIDLIYALPARYRRNGTFVMNSKTAGVVRKMKDADGRFLWNDGFAAGEPATLLGYRVFLCEDMPDVAANACAIAFGDFYTGYTIAERPDLRILRDPFSAKPHVLFYATKRVGGDVTDFASIKLLQFSA